MQMQVYFLSGGILLKIKGNPLVWVKAGHIVFGTLVGIYIKFFFFLSAFCQMHLSEAEWKSEDFKEGEDVSFIYFLLFQFNSISFWL